MTETKEITKEKAEAKTEVKTLESEERQTIVHCTCGEDYAFRIWPTTFLIEHDTNKQAKLLTAFNISFAPQWTLNDGKGFTLIFEGIISENISWPVYSLSFLKNLKLSILV